jgi:hypothetical protein
MTDGDERDDLASSWLNRKRCLSTRFPTEPLVTGTLPPDSAQHANGAVAEV